MFTLLASCCVWFVIVNRTAAPSKHVELLLVKFSVIVKVREEPWVLDTATSVGGCRCHSTLEHLYLPHFFTLKKCLGD